MELPAASDDGLADPQVAAALAGWRSGRTAATRAAALAALSTARVFAAVTPRSTGGSTGGSTAQMALVTLAGSSGRGVPVFLDVPSLLAFAPGARPVRLTAAQACTAALQDGAVAVVVDPSGAGLVLSRTEVTELAAGRIPVPGAALSTRQVSVALTAPREPDPQLVHALRGALRGEPLAAARLLDGPDGPVLGVVPRRPLDPAALAALAARLGPRLPQPLDLTVVPADGPGLPLRVRRRGGLGIRRRR